MQKMSDVRISNGSPPVERPDGRLLDPAKPPACRNLFGTCKEESTKDLNGHLREMEEEMSAKYNFDFTKDKPLQPGRYKWQLVDSKDVPEFYSRQQGAPKGICLSGNNNVDLNGNHNCLLVTPCQSNEDRFTEEKTEKSESAVDCKDQRSGKRKRPANHDSSPQNKRARTSSDEVTRTPALARSVEHTPRKTSPKTQTRNV
ncbi:cyclin-dependent kinase inhibitor 1B-like [Anguilla rostrata]|uniref:cyclin-dependent kinase inhibitor 1B-like n=1 Tax=Anguilla rostrata TaxID=7938 RepID=UPI0030CE7E6F